MNIFETSYGLNVLDVLTMKIYDNIKDIIQFIPGDNCIIYIDPPYSDTTGYGFNFDLGKFLSKLCVKTLSPIFVSEKRSLSNTSIKINFNGAKGGISGNKKGKNEEWLSRFN